MLWINLQLSFQTSSLCNQQLIPNAAFHCASRSAQTIVNPLTPNDHYRGRTAPLTCKRVILYIYSTNIGTECFKHGVYSLSFLLFKIQFVS